MEKIPVPSESSWVSFRRKLRARKFCSRFYESQDAQRHEANYALAQALHKKFPKYIPCPKYYEYDSEADSVITILSNEPLVLQESEVSVSTHGSNPSTSVLEQEFTWTRAVMPTPPLLKEIMSKDRAHDQVHKIRDRGEDAEICGPLVRVGPSMWNAAIRNKQAFFLSTFSEMIFRLRTRLGFQSQGDSTNSNSVIQEARTTFREEFLRYHFPEEYERYRNQILNGSPAPGLPRSEAKIIQVSNKSTESQVPDGPLPPKPIRKKSILKKGKLEKEASKKKLAPIIKSTRRSKNAKYKKSVQISDVPEIKTIENNNSKSITFALTDEDDDSEQVKAIFVFQDTKSARIRRIKQFQDLKFLPASAEPEPEVQVLFSVPKDKFWNWEEINHEEAKEKTSVANTIENSSSKLVLASKSSSSHNKSGVSFKSSSSNRSTLSSRSTTRSITKKAQMQRVAELSKPKIVKEKWVKPIDPWDIGQKHMTPVKNSYDRKLVSQLINRAKSVNSNVAPALPRPVKKITTIRRVVSSDNGRTQSATVKTVKETMDFLMNLINPAESVLEFTMVVPMTATKGEIFVEDSVSTVEYPLMLLRSPVIPPPGPTRSTVLFPIIVVNPKHMEKDKKWLADAKKSVALDHIMEVFETLKTTEKPVISSYPVVRVENIFSKTPPPERPKWVDPSFVDYSISKPFVNKSRPCLNGSGPCVNNSKPIVRSGSRVSSTNYTNSNNKTNKSSPHAASSRPWMGNPTSKPMVMIHVNKPSFMTSKMAAEKRPIMIKNKPSTEDRMNLIEMLTESKVNKSKPAVDKSKSFIEKNKAAVRKSKTEEEDNNPNSKKTNQAVEKSKAHVGDSNQNLKKSKSTVKRRASSKTKGTSSTKEWTLDVDYSNPYGYASKTNQPVKNSKPSMEKNKPVASTSKPSAKKTKSGVKKKKSTVKKSYPPDSRAPNSNFRVTDKDKRDSDADIDNSQPTVIKTKSKSVKKSKSNVKKDSKKKK